MRSICDMQIRTTDLYFRLSITKRAKALYFLDVCHMRLPGADDGITKRAKALYSLDMSLSFSTNGSNHN